jgi:hypothetical protein
MDTFSDRVVEMESYGLDVQLCIAVLEPKHCVKFFASRRLADQFGSS